MQSPRRASTVNVHKYTLWASIPLYRRCHPTRRPLFLTWLAHKVCTAGQTTLSCSKWLCHTASLKYAMHPGSSSPQPVARVILSPSPPPTEYLDLRGVKRIAFCVEIKAIIPRNFMRNVILWQWRPHRLPRVWTSINRVWTTVMIARYCVTFLRRCREDASLRDSAWGSTRRERQKGRTVRARDRVR